MSSTTRPPWNTYLRWCGERPSRSRTLCSQTDTTRASRSASPSLARRSGHDDVKSQRSSARAPSTLAPTRGANLSPRDRTGIYQGAMATPCASCPAVFPRWRLRGLWGDTSPVAKSRRLGLSLLETPQGFQRRDGASSQSRWARKAPPPGSGCKIVTCGQRRPPRSGPLSLRSAAKEPATNSRRCRSACRRLTASSIAPVA